MVPGFNDLTMTHAQLSAEWSFWNTELHLYMVNAKSTRNVWWKGTCGHSWKAKIGNRIFENAGCLC